MNKNEIPSDDESRALVRSPSYANELITEAPSRKIREELYRDTGYDAIWRLTNSGFVIRINDTHIFLDPLFTSPLPAYEEVRIAASKAGHVVMYELEMRHYDRWENHFKELQELPLPPEHVEKVDYILLSHQHSDHLDPDGLKRILHLKPTVVAPKACNQMLLEIAGLPSQSLVEAKHDETLDFEDFSIQVIPASHKNAPGACGFLIKSKHGNIYYTGDVDNFEADKEFILDLDVDVLLLPINDTNLGVGFASLLAFLLQPRIIIPCHWGYIYPPLRSMSGHPAEFLTTLAGRNYKLPNTDIMILTPGGKLVLA